MILEVFEGKPYSPGIPLKGLETSNNNKDSSPECSITYESLLRD